MRRRNRTRRKQPRTRDSENRIPRWMNCGHLVAVLAFVVAARNLMAPQTSAGIAEAVGGGTSSYSVLHMRVPIRENRHQDQTLYIVEIAAGAGGGLSASIQGLGEKKPSG
mmetsp:Transcript_4064/g.8820  ORF Transcript_4064/g.8820 Transcript_4064/m.8820 type:complete len:110 (-) Transcript_4064:18-347(-)